MSLDVAKLKQVREKEGNITAQCPACAEKGGDAKGDHLIIYPDGKYGCVVHPKDKAHLQEIFRLVGVPKQSCAMGGPVPIRIRRPACITRQPKVLLILHSLAEPVTAAEELKDRPVEAPPAIKPVLAEPEIQAVPAESPQKADKETNAPLPLAETPPTLPKWRNVSIRPSFMVSVKDGPGWEERVEAAKRKYAKN